MEDIDGQVGHTTFEEDEMFYLMRKDYAYLSDRVLAAPPEDCSKPWLLSTPGGFEYLPTIEDLDMLDSEELIGYISMSDVTAQYALTTMRISLPKPPADKCIAVILEDTMNALLSQVDEDKEQILAEAVVVLRKLQDVLRNR